MPRTRSFDQFCISVCAVVLLSFGCHQNADVPKGPAEKITLACAKHLSTVLVQIAHEEGFFEAAGIDVDLQLQTSGKDALQAVLQGKADIATVADTPIMLAVLDGEDISVLAVIQTSNRNEVVVARKDKGVLTPSDLKGKRIGVTLGTNGEFFLDSLLMAHGIDRTAVTVTDTRPEEMVSSLVSGNVDAVSTWSPHSQRMLRTLKEHGGIFYGEALYTETFCLVARRAFTKTRPEAIKKVLRALIMAESFVKRNPDESKQRVSAFTQTDRDMMDEIWDVFDFKVTLDQSLLVSLEEQSRWAMKRRLTGATKMPNYLEYIYPDGLDDVMPESVRIIR